MAELPNAALELRSKITASGRLELSLVSAPVPQPGPGQVLVRIEAAPINPSDLGLLLGPADTATLRTAGEVTLADVPPERLKAVHARLDQSMPVGNEGAGTVVATGAGAEALQGRIVATLAGGTYAQYRIARTADCIVLPDGLTAAQGASAFVNPLTALGFVETMRREGHTALVHTAAASNLGQMLNRLCLSESIALVNIVRSAAQARLLQEQGAAHVLDSTAPDFFAALVAALTETKATLAFDAIGGGPLAGQILSAMERAAVARMKSYSRYGSTVHKQVYVYGGLDLRPITLGRDFGMAWGVGGWLMPPFLQKIGPAEALRLREKVAAELTTTFASAYSREITLLQALEPAVIATYAKQATGEKFLIRPNG